MPSDLLLLRFSDGESEWRQPAEAPEIGSRMTRRQQDWIVTSIEADGHDVATVVHLSRVREKAPPEAKALPEATEPSGECTDSRWPGPIDEAQPLLR